MANSAMPQANYLEKITIEVPYSSNGTSAVSYQFPTYFEKISGGEVTFAMGKYKPAGFRGEKSIPGRFSVSDLNLENVYKPDNAYKAMTAAILSYLLNPGLDPNGITVYRYMPNSPGLGDGAFTTRIEYSGCMPMNVPTIGDGDVTQDDGLARMSLKFTCESVSFSIGQGANQVKLGVGDYLAQGWDGGVINPNFAKLAAIAGLV